MPLVTVIINTNPVFYPPQEGACQEPAMYVDLEVPDHQHRIVIEEMVDDKSGSVCCDVCKTHKDFGIVTDYSLIRIIVIDSKDKRVTGVVCWYCLRDIHQQVEVMEFPIDELGLCAEVR